MKSIWRHQNKNLTLETISHLHLTLTSVYFAGIHFKLRLSSGVHNSSQPECLLFWVFLKKHSEKACSFLLYSEWILWGNGSINCDTATLFVKFFHKEITASGTHRPTYYSQTTHWEEMHWPQVCYITVSVTPPRIWIVHLDEVSEVIKSSHELGLIQFWRP